jgi:hypothetical protein
VFHDCCVVLGSHALMASCILGGQVIGYDRRQPLASAIIPVNLSELNRHSSYLHQLDLVPSATPSLLVCIPGP